MKKGNKMINSVLEYLDVVIEVAVIVLPLCGAGAAIYIPKAKALKQAISYLANLDKPNKEIFKEVVSSKQLANEFNKTVDPHEDYYKTGV